MLAACLLAAALSAPQDEAGFVAGLAEARVAFEKRDWKKAEGAARALLTEHERRPYVWLHLPELVDLLESSSFFASYVEPEPRTLISGELISYSKSGANLKLRYTPKTLGDFQVVGGEGDTAIRLHPVVFAGAYTVEIKGPSYPSGGDDKLVPTLLYGMEERAGQAVAFGFSEFRSKGRLLYAPATLRIREDGEWRDDDSQQAEPGVGGEPFDLKVKVEDTRITVTSNGKPLFTSKKKSNVLGQIGFAGFTPFGELLISGRAQPGWLQGKLDEHLQAAWERHASKLRRESPLPEWLALKPAGGGKMLEFDPRELPMPSAKLSPKKIAELLETKPGQIRKAFEALEKLGADEVPDGLRTWLTALLHYRGRHLEDALVACEQVSTEFPDFVAAKRLRARLYLRLGKDEQALAIGREVCAADPEDDRAAAELAELQFSCARYDDFVAHLRARAELGRFTTELDELNSLFSRAKNGPGWQKPIEVKTAHYVVASDIDRKTCVEAAEMLENSLARFQARLGALPKERTEPFRVYLFSGFAGYRRYVRDALDAGAENTAGMYHFALEQLLIWNLPDHEQMLRTVRHEGLHQFMAKSFGELPRWVHEGLAEFYENAEFTRGPSREIVTHPEHLPSLQGEEAKLVPLAEFVRYDPEDFMRDAELHYAEAWAFVHFLMTGPPARKAILDSLLASSRTGIGWEESVERAFESVDVAALEREFVAHVAALKE